MKQNKRKGRRRRRGDDEARAALELPCYWVEVRGCRRWASRTFLNASDRYRGPTLRHSHDVTLGERLLQHFPIHNQHSTYLACTDSREGAKQRLAEAPEQPPLPLHPKWQKRSRRNTHVHVSPRAAPPLRPCRPSAQPTLL